MTLRRYYRGKWPINEGSDDKFRSWLLAGDVPSDTKAAVAAVRKASTPTHSLHAVWSALKPGTKEAEVKAAEALRTSIEAAHPPDDLKETFQAVANQYFELPDQIPVLAMDDVKPTQLEAWLRHLDEHGSPIKFKDQEERAKRCRAVVLQVYGFFESLAEP